MSLFLTDLAKRMLEIGDIPLQMERLLRTIETNPEYCPSTTGLFMYLESAFEKEFIFETGELRV